MNKIKNKIIILSAVAACCSFAFGGAMTLKDDAEIIVNAGSQTITLEDVTFVMDNPLILIFAGIPLVGLGIGMVKRMISL